MRAQFVAEVEQLRLKNQAISAGKKREAIKYKESLKVQDDQVRAMQTKALKLEEMLHNANTRAERHTSMVATLEHKAKSAENRARLLEAGLNGLRQQADDVVRTGSLGPEDQPVLPAPSQQHQVHHHHHQQQQQQRNYHHVTNLNAAAVSAAVSVPWGGYTPSPLRPVTDALEGMEDIGGGGGGTDVSSSTMLNFSALEQQQQPPPPLLQQQPQQQPQQQQHGMFTSQCSQYPRTQSDMATTRTLHVAATALDDGTLPSVLGRNENNRTYTAGNGNHDESHEDEQRAMAALSASLHKLFSSLGSSTTAAGSGAGRASESPLASTLESSRNISRAFETALRTPHDSPLRPPPHPASSATLGERGGGEGSDGGV